MLEIGRVPVHHLAIAALTTGALFLSNAAEGWSADSLASWHLPATLSDSNTKVTFELDSTWHTVHGVTSGIRGNAWLSDPTDSTTVHLEAMIPVSRITTDGESRDEVMREVMTAERFPNVRFTGSRLSGSCSPAIVRERGWCKDILVSELTIRDVTKPFEVPVTIRFVNGTFKVEGEITIQWGAFGVQDPSILIARVDPNVKISFSVVLSGEHSDAASTIK